MTPAMFRPTMNRAGDAVVPITVRAVSTRLGDNTVVNLNTFSLSGAPIGRPWDHPNFANIWLTVWGNQSFLQEDGAGPPEIFGYEAGFWNRLSEQHKQNMINHGMDYRLVREYP
jgi:hypothetical protein